MPFSGRFGASAAAGKGTGASCGALLALDVITVSCLG